MRQLLLLCLTASLYACAPAEKKWNNMDYCDDDTLLMPNQPHQHKVAPTGNFGACTDNDLVNFSCD